MQKRGKNKLGQVWVETVVYTLIGLSIIGIVLGIATPRIKQMTDKAIIEQTLVAMNEMNQKIIVVQTAEGQSRKIDFRIKKGKIVIEPLQNKISFIIEDTGLKYSQPGAEIPLGDLIILTEENGKKYDIHIILDYSNSLNLKFEGAEDEKVLTQATVPYQILIKNKGDGVLDITLI